MTAYLRFQQGDEKIEYIYKSEEISFDYFKSTIPSTPDKSLDWRDDINYKNVSILEKVISDVFDKNIVCFFGPNRYMKPGWENNTLSKMTLVYILCNLEKAARSKIPSLYQTCQN